jgi:hypothetical protein
LGRSKGPKTPYLGIGTVIFHLWEYVKTHNTQFLPISLGFAHSVQIVNLLFLGIFVFAPAKPSGPKNSNMHHLGVPPFWKVLSHPRFRQFARHASSFYPTIDPQWFEGVTHHG